MILGAANTAVWVGIILSGILSGVALLLSRAANAQSKENQRVGEHHRQEQRITDYLVQVDDLHNEVLMWFNRMIARQHIYGQTKVETYIATDQIEAELSVLMALREKLTEERRRCIQMKATNWIKIKPKILDDSLRELLSAHGLSRSAYEQDMALGETKKDG
ncbi:MAG: hypothetical protein ACYTDT_10400 [Planctomycetota bacterium]|jgi:hypothetical protein